MSKKTVCDICGKEALEADFVLPRYETYICYETYILSFYGEEKISAYRNKIVQRKMNLCSKHAKSLDDWIDSEMNLNHACKIDNS